MQQLREAMAQKMNTLLLYHTLECTACTRLANQLAHTGNGELAVISVDTNDKANQGLLNADKKGPSFF
jgi:hypothetical protein